MLKEYQICVIPDVDNYDNLPFFSIIETSLKDTSKKSKIKRMETDLKQSPMEKQRRQVLKMD